MGKVTIEGTATTMPEEKHEPVSDIDTAVVVDGLKCLTPNGQLEKRTSLEDSFPADNFVVDSSLDDARHIGLIVRLWSYSVPDRRQSTGGRP
jgi:hypothetical protein